MHLYGFTCTLCEEWEPSSCRATVWAPPPVHHTQLTRLRATCTQSLLVLGQLSKQASVKHAQTLPRNIHCHSETDSNTVDRIHSGSQRPKSQSSLFPYEFQICFFFSSSVYFNHNLIHFNSVVKNHLLISQSQQHFWMWGTSTAGMWI